MDLEARIAELESELAEANETIRELRGYESENRALKDRVHALHSELITLSPPKLPVFSSGPAEPETPSGLARAKRSRLITWTALFLVLAGAVVAGLPYLFSHLDATNRIDGQFTNQRGLGEMPE